MLCAPKSFLFSSPSLLSFILNPICWINFSIYQLMTSYCSLSKKIILIPDSRKMEKLWGGTGRKGNALIIFTHTHTHTHTQSELKIVQWWFRKGSRCDNLRLSFLFLLDYHASYCFNLVFQIYFLHSSSILPVTRGFYCYEISCQEICCRWEHL